eukprot:GHVR01059995.1.p1 GENE.GHVR01059995.1~~GHVR01059995.1.p1  ORF type:complete len:1002 (+),score=248.41 GHVR01059995.1:125-3007(+)
MATLDDIEANAEYITASDFMVEVPSGTNNYNYGNISLIVQIAEETACDAVWPGWGHASENFRLPQLLQKAKRKIVWIGPTAPAMIALGDKIGSTILAQSVDVQCVAWSGAHVRLGGEDQPLCQSLVEAACVKTPEAAIESIKKNKINYPLLLKASAGGGGKGIRKCECESEVHGNFRQVISEVKGSAVLAMQMISRCRHLEVQIIADLYGDVVSLGTRDCTIQRRSQKMIEEGSVLAAPRELVLEMEDAAVRMVKKVGYTNAGTVEFLYDAEMKKIFFCEVNARLQVEHVVTELLSEVNLPAAQLQVAMGVPLHNIVDVARYRELKSTDSLPKKHCIACRVTAEHAEAGFVPTCGDVLELSLRASGNVWGYFSIGSAGRIHQYADSQFGHVFSTADTRDDARCNMIVALKNLTVRGEIRTNIEALMRILENSDFIQNKTSTTWLETSLGFGTPLPSFKLPRSQLLAVLLAAACDCHKVFTDSEAAFHKQLNQGQLPPTLALEHTCELVYKSIKYKVTGVCSGPNSIILCLNHSYAEVHMRIISGQNGRLITGGFDGRTRVVYCREETGGLTVNFDGVTYTFTRENDPTQVRAPMSGKLVRWIADNNKTIMKGHPYAEIEIMKMYLSLTVHETGIITHVLSEGAVFKHGDLLATLVLPEHVTVEKSKQSVDTFPACGDKKLLHGRVSPLRELRGVLLQITHLFSGYKRHADGIEACITMLRRHILDPSLAAIELDELLAEMQYIFPESLLNSLEEIAASLDSNPPPIHEESIPAVKVQALVSAQLAEQSRDGYEGPLLQPQHVDALEGLLTKYSRGVLGAAVNILDQFFRFFVANEIEFHNSQDTPGNVLLSKRSELSTTTLLTLGRSHEQLQEVLKLTKILLEEIRSHTVLMGRLVDLKSSLTELSSLSRPVYSCVCLRARQLLLIRSQPPLHERTYSLLSRLLKILHTHTHTHTMILIL